MRAPVRFLRANEKPMPNRDEVPQLINHPRAFFTGRRPAENMDELFFQWSLQLPVEEAFQKFVAQALRHLAL